MTMFIYFYLNCANHKKPYAPFGLSMGVNFTHLLINITALFASFRSKLKEHIAPV